MKQPLLLNAEKARQHLGVSERGLRDLVKQGLPYIIVGRRRMFPPNDIAAWITEQVRSVGQLQVRPSRRPATPWGIGFDEAVRRTVKK